MILRERLLFNVGLYLAVVPSHLYTGGGGGGGGVGASTTPGAVSVATASAAASRRSRSETTLIRIRSEMTLHSPSMTPVASAKQLLGDVFGGVGGGVGVVTHVAEESVEAVLCVTATADDSTLFRLVPLEEVGMCVCCVVHNTRTCLTCSL